MKLIPKSRLDAGLANYKRRFTQDEELAVIYQAILATQLVPLIREMVEDGDMTGMDIDSPLRTLLAQIEELP